MPTPLAVTYRPPWTADGSGYVLWETAKPIADGVFPSDHPASPDGTAVANDPSYSLGTSLQMAQIRALGYTATCLEDGTGLSLRGGRRPTIVEGAIVPGFAITAAASVAADVADVFGWDVTLLDPIEPEE
jgi:hypothetical protein